MKLKFSVLALILSYFILILVHFGYYPKWTKSDTEATISWDVAGYYAYLPALFIYNDIKQCDFELEMQKKYNFSGVPRNSFEHKASGNRVLKYSIGQAVLFAPSFGLGHLWAQWDDKYPADGYSRPYQLAISLGSLFIAFIGLFFMRKNLLYFFDEKTTGIGLLLLLLGSNYLNYTAIDGAMTHNNVFMLYALLIYTTIQFYERPNALKAAGIGIFVGLAALTRPTELISILIPLLWGMKGFSKEAIREKANEWKSNAKLIFVAGIFTAMVGSIQLLYWKYVSGDWLVYSYEDQGFSWLSPHILDGVFSYKSGWLVYSPMMVFALLGFIPLFKKDRSLFWVSLIFSSLFIYIAFAWDIWWYGGSLGQRTMVQAYAILLFPLCAGVDYWFQMKKIGKIIFGALTTLFVYINLWFTHQAHKGGYFRTAQMTSAYYWKTIGRYDFPPDIFKLLDTRDYFDGEVGSHSVIYDFPIDTSSTKEVCLVKREGVWNRCLSDSIQYSQNFFVPIEKGYKWLRVSADFYVPKRNDMRWDMTQFIIEYWAEGKQIKDEQIRLERFLQSKQEDNIYIDTKIPRKAFDEVSVRFWNPSNSHTIHYKNLEAFYFNPQ